MCLPSKVSENWTRCRDQNGENLQNFFVTNKVKVAWPLCGETTNNTWQFKDKLRMLDN